MRSWLPYTPFIVFVLLFPINWGGHLWLYPRLGISEETGISISLSLIGIGLLLGLAGLAFSKTLRWYWRLLIAVAYLPVIVWSLLLSGL